MSQLVALDLKLTNMIKFFRHIRKSLLEQEVKRTEAKILSANDHLSAAENLFK